jgi:hypothetical protein
MSKKKAEATMDQLWVMTATVLAFQKANEMASVEYFREFARDKKGLFRKVEAFRRDPANREAIIAERRAAAEQIGRGATKQ